MKTRCLSVAFFLAALFSAAVAFGVQSERDPVARVRELVLSLDPHGALRLATAESDAVVDSEELRAWTLLALVGSGQDQEAMERSQAFVDEQPQSGWAWFALAGVQMQQRGEQEAALQSSARARELLGDHPDALRLHVQVLIAADRYDEAVELTTGPWDDPEVGSAMSRQRSRALYYLAGARDPDPEVRAESLAAARTAVELAPSSADAVFGLARMLDIYGETEEGAELVQRARELSPGSVTIRQQVWQGIIRRSDLDADEKLDVLHADIEDLVELHERSPAVLHVAQGALGRVNAPELRDRYADEVLAVAPDGPEAESIAVARYRDLRDELFSVVNAASAEGPSVEPDPALVARYREALKEFLSRGRFHRSTLRGDAYRELFGISAYGDGVPAEELLDIVNGMAEYEGINVHLTHAAGPIALAERTHYYERAEQLVRDGFALARKRVEGQRWAYATDADFDQAMDRYEAILRDALGWVMFQADRRDDAEPELTRAHELDPDNLTNLYHLGKLREHDGDRLGAERFYVQGLNVPRPGANPNRTALEALYERDNGSLEGFDGYLERIAGADAEARHTEILASRRVAPEAPEPFDLATLTGERVSDDALTGRITVVNFWGIWCYWCVIEMPELQQLHERYADDPDVVILTINNDENPTQVPAWMQENGYSFPVLLDDGYVAKVGVGVFPTTWFIDPKGRIAFVKESWSQELVQEYSWRIEAIRDSGH